MAKLSRVTGTTSQIVNIFVQDNSVATGAGLTGLTNSSSGLTCYYKRNTGSASVSVTLASATLGTFTSGGFKEVDSTNMPGVYELGIPNAALTSGADSVVVMLQGATHMAPVTLEIELTAVNNQNGNNFGLAYLPQAPMQLKKNQSLSAFPFPMFDSNGNPKTGLTVTCQRSLDGGSFASINGGTAAVEIGNGWYYTPLLAGDTNGNAIAFRFSATGAQDTDWTFITQA